MSRLFWRIFKAHAALHLGLPLVVSILIGSAVAIWEGHRPTDLRGYWLAGPIWELLAIYFTFVLVFLVSASRETKVRMADIAVLKDALPGSSGYLGLGVIGFEEWFDPSVQAYLSTIVAHQLKTPGYCHERVLLFFDDAALEDVHLSYSSEHYARCFTAIHEEFGIPLSFLRPDELADVLEALPEADRQRIGWRPRGVGFLPGALSRLVTRHWLKRHVSTRAFLVTRPAGPPVVLRFSKEHRVLNISKLNDAEAVQGYVRLADLVKARIYKPGTMDLSRNHEFSSYIKT
jgi:hypothetical protein